MSTRERSPVERVVETVSSWPGITTAGGRFDSTVFRLAGREIGHVHRWGPVDVGYPKPIRDQLIADGLTGEHHVVPNSNATTFRVESTDDVERAVTLLRIAYLYHASVIRRTAVEAGEIEDVDVGAELRELDLSDELLAVTTQSMSSGRN